MVTTTVEQGRCKARVQHGPSGGYMVCVHDAGHLGDHVTPFGKSWSGNPPATPTDIAAYVFGDVARQLRDVAAWLERRAPDAVTAELIGIDAALIDAGYEHPRGLAGVRDALGHLEQLREEHEQCAELAENMRTDRQTLADMNRNQSRQIEALRIRLQVATHGLHAGVSAGSRLRDCLNVECAALRLEFGPFGTAPSAQGYDR